MRLKDKIVAFNLTLAIALIAVAILVKAIEIVTTNCYAACIAGGLVAAIYICCVTGRKENDDDDKEFN